jgi:hypothetical protein
VLRNLVARLAGQHLAGRLAHHRTALRVFDDLEQHLVWWA